MRLYQSTINGEFIGLYLPVHLIHYNVTIAANMLIRG